MPFIGFNFNKIEASKDVEEVRGNINIKHTLNITDIKQQEIMMDQKQEVLKFTFEFKLNYEPNIGGITLTGNMLYLEDLKKMKEIIQEWKKDKKIPQNITEGLFNTILTKANIKALNLAQDINLPPHLPLPKIEPANKKDYSQYIG